MQANTDRIQTTHVGSLVRPPELVAYMRKRLEREAVDDTAYEQYLTTGHRRRGRAGKSSAGLDVVNDGEYSEELLVPIRDRAARADSNSAQYPAKVPNRRRRPAVDFERFRDFYADIPIKPASQCRSAAIGR